MAEPITPPITLDPEQIFQDSFVAAMQAAFPDWEPADGNLDSQLGEAFAHITAQLGESASDNLTDIFRFFGAGVASIPPIDATAASGTVTFTLTDTDGHAITAGTMIGKDLGDSGLVMFQTTVDVDVAPGVAIAAGVPVVATEENPGAIGSGIDGEAEQIEPLDFIDTVVFDAPTSGGFDAEDDNVYLSRLVEELRLLTPRPILPGDFTVLTKRVIGVDRALTLDGYDPDTDTFDNERMVTIFALDAAGEAVSSGVKTLIDVLFNGDGATIEAMREVTFEIHVDDPTYTSVDVNFTATALPGWDPAAVSAGLVAAVQTYLDPALWGQPMIGETRAWVNKNKVRLGELYTALNTVPGVHTVDAVTFRKHATGSFATTDLLLDGPAPLPRSGTITPTVT
jgi:hypothetical protein